MARGRFRVRIIRAGLSLNGNYYSAALLRGAASQFNGVRVFAKSDREHLAMGGKDVSNLIGRIVAPEFLPGATPDTGELVGTLELIDPDSEIGRKITKAAERDMLDLFGLSIDVEGVSEAATVNGRRVRVARSFEKVHSVDLIVEPGAGGQVVNLIEAAGPAEAKEVMTREQIIALIRAKRPEALQGKDPDTMSDAELSEMLASLLEPAEQDGGGDRMAEAAVEARIRMRERINASRLPDNAKARLIGEFTARGTFTEAEVSRRIQDEGTYLTRATGMGGGHVTGQGDPSFIEMDESRREKVGKMLDAFFDPKNSSVISIRECYVDITGDRHFTGQLRNCDQVRLREALGTDTLDVVLGDAIGRRMVQEYQTNSVYDVWRDMVTIVPVQDFRTQERVRFGGYGDLPAVAQSAPYLDLASPTDEKAEYAVTKRGGLETITLEAITNDDVGLVQRVPLKLAQAAKRTLSKFVLSIPQTNPVIYDGIALFHATHGNLGAAALSSDAVGAGRVAMKAQKEKDSNEKLGIGPSFLWVPDELEEDAWNLFRRATNLDADFIQSLQLQVRPVWCWEDADDWCMTAETRDVPFVELGFLGGREDPELFVQDSPTSGSMFSHDKLTYKIRHIYGGVVVDFRGAYKSVPPAA